MAFAIERIVSKDASIDALPAIVYWNFFAPNPKNDVNNIQGHPSSDINDIKLYWREALNLQVLETGSFISSFENASPGARFKYVRYHLNSNKESDLLSILREHLYIRCIKYILAIIWLVDGLSSSAIISILKTTFAPEYIATIALNSPSFVNAALEVICSPQIPISSPECLISSFLAFHEMSSRSRSLSIIARDLLIRRQVFPVLCVELSRQYIDDLLEVVDALIDDSVDLKTNWLLSTIPTKMILEIIADACKAISSPQNGHRVDGSSQNLHSIIRPSRILAFMTVVSATVNSPFISTTTSLSHCVSEWLEAAAQIQTTIALELDIRSTFGALISMLLVRLAVLSTQLHDETSSLPVAFPTDRRIDGSTATATSSSSSAAADLISNEMREAEALLRSVRRAADMKYEESLQSLILFLDIALAFSCPHAIIELALTELRLPQLFLPVSQPLEQDDLGVWGRTFSVLPSVACSNAPSTAIHVEKEGKERAESETASTAAFAAEEWKIIRQYQSKSYSRDSGGPGEGDKDKKGEVVFVEFTRAGLTALEAAFAVKGDNDGDNNLSLAFTQRFLDLTMPPEISGSLECPGDWVAVLALLIGCDSFNECGGSQCVSVPSSSSSGPVCDLLHVVILRAMEQARLPLHTWLQRVLDWWVLRCMQSSKVPRLLKSTAGGNVKSGDLFLPLRWPLLPSEAERLYEPITSENVIIYRNRPPCADAASEDELEKRGRAVKRRRNTVSPSHSAVDESGDLDSHVKYTMARLRMAKTSASTRRVIHATSGAVHSAGSGHADESDARVLPGILACYVALQTAALSTDITSRCLFKICVPLSVDIYSAPTRRAIQILMHYMHSEEHWEDAEGHNEVESLDPGCDVGAAELLRCTIVLTRRLQPALLLPGKCSIMDSSSLQVKLSTRKATDELRAAGAVVKLVARTIASSTAAYRALRQYVSKLVQCSRYSCFDGNDNNDRTLPSKAMTAVFVSHLGPRDVIRFLKDELVHAALSIGFPISSLGLGLSSSPRPTDHYSMDVDVSVADALFALWLLLHKAHPAPSCIELVTANTLLTANRQGITIIAVLDDATEEVINTSDARGFYLGPGELHSYIGLVQEPMLLLRLQLYQSFQKQKRCESSLPGSEDIGIGKAVPLLLNPFVLRVALFITRKALFTSRCAVRETQKANRMRWLELFHGKGHNVRSTLEAVTPINPELYSDMTELIALRLLLSLAANVTYEDSPLTETLTSSFEAPTTEASCSRTSRRPICSNSLRQNLLDTLTAMIQELVSTNIRLPGLILTCGVGSPNDFELLCKSIAISSAVGEVLLSTVISLTQSFSAALMMTGPSTTIPAQATLPSTTTLEHVLKHLILHLRCCCGSDVSRRLAMSLPRFIYQAALSVNSFLNRHDTHTFEALLMELIDLLGSLYPTVFVSLSQLDKKQRGGGKQPIPKGSDLDKRIMHKYRDIVRRSCDPQRSAKDRPPSLSVSLPASSSGGPLALGAGPRIHPRNAPNNASLNVPDMGAGVKTSPEVLSEYSRTALYEGLKIGMAAVLNNCAIDPEAYPVNKLLSVSTHRKS